MMKVFLVVVGLATPLEFNSVTECEAAQGNYASAGIQSSCSATTESVNAQYRAMVSELQALEALKIAEEARWRGTDRVWCSITRDGMTSKDDPRYWPDLRECRKNDPPCPFQAKRPGPCPQ